MQIEAIKSLPDKQIILGVVALDNEVAETPEVVAARIREALKYIAADKLVVAPDCGMKYLPRASAFAKLKAMAEGAAIVRREIS